MQTRKKIFSMIFSKTTLFAAAAALAAPVAFAGYVKDFTVGGTTETETAKDAYGYVIIENDSETGNATITVERTSNISGVLLDANGKISGSQDGKTNFVKSPDSTLTITGGGVLEYSPGSANSKYYTGYYQLTRNGIDGNYFESPTTDAQQSQKNVWTAWEDFGSFWSSGAYTGAVEITGGTKLLLEGQLTQYVELYHANSRISTTAGTLSISGYMGVSSIKLSGGSILSFEDSKLNLMDSRPSMTSSTPDAGYAPIGILALNFANNLQSDATSTVVIGTDEESRNRIVFNADGDDDDASTVGRLNGNGRIYTTGAGTISFIGQSELNNGSNSDTSGNLWKSGNRLADIILGTATVNLGSEGGTNVVNNVFANATAVQLESSSDGAISTLTNSYGILESHVIGAGGSYMNGGANYIDSFATSTTVNVYGRQVFNNFQSLWVERTELLSASVDDLSNLTSMVSQIYEPVKFAYHNTDTGGDVYSRVYGTSVVVKANSVLTINQDVGRDGWYKGTLNTRTNDGIVVKTGEGRFYYDNLGNFGYLSNLRVEAGEWIMSGELSDLRVTITDTGSFRWDLSGTFETSDFLFQAPDTTATLVLTRHWKLENGLTTDSLAAVTAGTALEDIDADSRYRYYEYQGDKSTKDGIQITRQQNMFYGAVVVEDSLWLTLGGKDKDGGEYFSKSVFSHASEIRLEGYGLDDDSWAEQYSRLVVHGMQLVRNLYGEAGKSAVLIENPGDTLVLTRTSDNTNTYTGGFSGNGNLVLLGTDSPINHNLNGELTGAVTLITGSANVTQTGANTGFSALLLKKGTSATFRSSSRVGALVGEEGSSVSISGVFTVGGNGTLNSDTTATDKASSGSYFATADYDSYDEYFSGTGVESKLDSLETAVNRVRNGVTTTNSLNYIKNPAELIYTRETSSADDFSTATGTSASVADGAFREVFTSTGTDNRGHNVFTAMATGATSDIFGDATTVRAWLKNIFTDGKNGVSETLTEYLASDDANILSDSQREDLVTIASNIAGSPDGVDAFLDDDGNLNTVGWNKLVSAGTLEYLKSLDSGLDDLEDDSLYSFITHYDSDYGFVLTEAVAKQIADVYGVNTSTWFSNAGVANYTRLYESFGISSADFAGTLSGSGGLYKSGVETLRLTNSGNSFTGKTTVYAGELYTTRYAVKNTSGIEIDSNALLTIEANKTDNVSEYSTDRFNDTTTLNTSYSTYLENDTARISGTGTILKIGDGNVNLNHAFYNVADGATDFTGAIIIADGALRATVDAVTRTEGEDPLAFSIYFSDNSDTTTTTAPQFDLVFAATAAGNSVAELDFTGKISGTNGTFTLAAGTTTSASGTLVGNNVLNIADAENFTVGTVVLKSGALKFTVGTGSGTTLSPFSTIEMGSGADLVFDLSSGTNATLSDTEIAKGKNSSDVATYTGNLVVYGSETKATTGETVVSAGTLTLSDATLDGISGIAVRTGAGLTLNSSDSFTGTVYLGSLATDAGTILTIGSGYTLDLSAETAVLAGTLKGDGKLAFDGTKLTLGAETVRQDVEIVNDAFSGTISADISRNNVTINFVAGNVVDEYDDEVGEQIVTYAGLSIAAEVTASELRNTSLILQKTGVGTVVIKNNDGNSNKISSERFAIDVDAGELQVSGSIFETTGSDTTVALSGLLSTDIAENSTLRFIDDFGELANDENVAMIFQNLSGKGTLAFESSETTTLNVSEFAMQKFTGIVEISENTTLNLGENVTEFAALAGTGTVSINASDFKIRTDANADGAQVFDGTLKFASSSASLAIVGDGAAAFSENSIADIDAITVGSATENGGVGVSQNWVGTISAQGATSRVLILDGSETDYISTSATVSVADSVKNLHLAGTGMLALGDKAVASAFALKKDDSSEFVLDGSVDVEVANIAGTTLTLENLSELSAENFSLKANGENADGNAGGIVFSGNVSSATSGASTYSSRALMLLDDTTTTTATGTGVWTKDISGTGSVKVTDGANLTLTANTLTYTGETVVDGNSTLTYAATSGNATVSSSSKLTVRGGSTLVGGVDLIAENSDVVFDDGSTFVFTGNAISFNGIASVESSGKINIVLDSAALKVRGSPVPLFSSKSGEGNEITFDNITFGYYTTDGDFVSTSDVTATTTLAEGSVHFYKDSADAAGTVIYVATDNLAGVPGVNLHKGLDSNFIAYLSKIATPTESGTLQTSLSDSEKLIAEAIIKTPNGSLSETLTNLSPLGYAAMPALMQSGFLSDISAVSARIEQRRYDNYSTFIWEIENDWEFFAQAKGSFNTADDANDTRVFDMDIYGIIAGADVKLSATSVLGFSLAYDHGKADIHNGGGKIESDDMRATAFFGTLFAEQFYLDLGVQAGVASFDVKRKTMLGGTDGSATGYHAGAFANLGVLLPLWLSEDEKSGLNLMPHVGLAFSYYNVGSFDEDGAATALDTDSITAPSLRASIGATLAYNTMLFDKVTRLNLDFEYSRELMDSDIDIDFKMKADSAGEKLSATAPAFAENTFSIGPRVSFDLDKDNSIYAGYRFDFTTDSDVSHSVNIGFRSRF